jgi:hypothetical protein
LRSSSSADRQSTYGGHTIFRRGVTSVKLEGVELAYLGQGGFIMRYPLHYHILVDAPIYTFVRDCSIVRSWNRWYRTLLSRSAHSVPSHCPH